MPHDWHYAVKLLPLKVSESQALEWIGRTTRRHSELTWLYGTPDEVTDQLLPFIEAGVSQVSFIDLLPFVLDPEDAMTAIRRPIEASGLLKQKAGALVTA